MKVLKKIKNNKAIGNIDVIIGLLILIMFTGIFTTSFYQIYKHNMQMYQDSIIVSYAIKIIEDMDKKAYEEVTEELNDTINQDYELVEGVDANLKVEKYNKDDSNKEDIIKILTLSIKYQNIDQEDKEYTIKKLKIKEL